RLVVSALVPYTTLFRSYGGRDRRGYGVCRFVAATPMIAIVVAEALVILICPRGEFILVPTAVASLQPEAKVLGVVLRHLAELTRSEEHTSELQSPDHIV